MFAEEKEVEEIGEEEGSENDLDELNDLGYMSKKEVPLMPFNLKAENEEG